jgi:hypothetical protein
LRRYGNGVATLLGKNHVATSEISPEELISEVWLKLLGTVSLLDDDGCSYSNDSSIDLQAPERDGRVVWLIEEIGGREAIAHRREDILRQRHGRNVPGRGRRMLQHENESEAEIGWDDPDENPNGLQDADARRVWLGFCRTAGLHFKQDDDASMLHKLMADVPDILDDSSGDQWPVKRMVALLNDRFPPPPWNGDRVDNAKRRLQNWVKRLMQKNGFDVTDLEGLFARVAREQTTGKRASLPELPHPKLQSW